MDTDTPEGSYDFELVITSNNTEYTTYNSTSTITIDVEILYQMKILWLIFLAYLHPILIHLIHQLS